MAIHSDFDHELKIGSTTERFRLIRGDNKAPLYSIENFVPQYRDPLTFTQRDWKGGHGQYSMRVPDKYFEGQSIDTTQDGRVFLGPAITTVVGVAGAALDSAPVKFIWFPAVSKWFCATGGKIFVYSTLWTEVTTAGVAGVTDLCVFGAYLFAACGASTAYRYSTDGMTWTTVTTLADLYAVKFFVAPNSAGTAEVLWKAVTNELKSNTSGLLGGAAWSSAAYIGDTSTNITNIFLSGDKLLIGKTDGLWYYDSDGGIHQQRPDLDSNKSTDNFKYVTWWSAGIYHSEVNGMGEILTNDNYDPMSPLRDIGNIGKRGDIVGLAADREFLYVAIDEGTNTIIYKGREIYREGLRWEWCPFVFLGAYTCATMAVNQHTATDRRLWFGYTTGTTYATAYVTLSDNPTADSAYRFTTSGFVRMSYDYGSDARWDKMWQSAVLEVKGGASGETVQVKYRKDTDTSATECIVAATTNGVYESNFTAELACKRIQFEINLASDTNTATPEVSYFQAKGVEKPTTTRIHEAVYAIGDEPSTRSETLRDLLRTARTSTTLIRFADLRYNETTGGTAGTDFVYAVLEPGYPQEIEVFHRDKGSTPEMGLKVRFRVCRPL